MVVFPFHLLINQLILLLFDLCFDMHWQKRKLPPRKNMTHIFVFVFDLRRIGKSETSSQEKYDSPTHLGLDQPPGDQGWRVLDLAEIFLVIVIVFLIVILLSVFK